MPKAGEVIAERYELLAHLGDGGTASVWRAKDLTLEREVAIKFLYVVDERQVEELRKQFLREARIACAVKHRNVIQTMDFGQTDGGRAYMVMELLHGEELTQRIDTEPRLSVEEAVQIVSDVLRGLNAIHEGGIVHRDLKPENIYLERDQDSIYPKILDFGIAKSIDRTRGASRRSVLTTKEGLVVGTPEYMPPEQARGVRDLDARADVWSVGVIMFELLTGKLPFDEPSEAEVIIKVVTVDAPKAIDVNPDIPKSLSDIIAKALMRDRDQRYQTALEMQQALQEATRAIESEVPPAVRAAQRRRRAALWAAVAVVASLLVMMLLRVRALESARNSANDKPATVRVELHGVPDSALVLVNGKPANGTKLSLPNDGHSRLIEVQASGRQPWRVMHPAGNSADYEVRMPLLLQTTPTAAAGSEALDPSPTPGSHVKTEPRRPRNGSETSSAPRVQGPRAMPAKPAAAKTSPDKKAPTVWRDLDF
jgi:serine/threonine protein kinase